MSEELTNEVFEENKCTDQKCPDYSSIASHIHFRHRLMVNTKGDVAEETIYGSKGGGKMSNLESLDIVDDRIWRPTFHLRWAHVAMVEIKGDQMRAIADSTLELQQAWETDDGSVEWRPVPVVD